MTAPRIYLSTTIPYVNGRPHLGHALELVQADVLARHWRRVGREVRFQTGTDENSLKNVLAAAAEGISPSELVRRNAALFAALREPLCLSYDDFLRTSTDPRHAPGAERLWRACAARGDLYRRFYEGLYCVGCEQFYQPAELDDGLCPEHGTPPQQVAEENWFFRLSRYADRLRTLITAGELRIEPAARRNEVLAFIAGGLADISVSRSVRRARGWGIRVPDDPTQVIYVWFDALGNYLTGPGYGSDCAAYARWWTGASRRVHLVGKGVLRFHAVYWPAILLSAGEPLPTDILVHDYLTIAGNKISKSGNVADAGGGRAHGAGGGGGEGAGGGGGGAGGGGGGGRGADDDQAEGDRAGGGRAGGGRAGGGRAGGGRAGGGRAGGGRAGGGRAGGGRAGGDREDGGQADPVTLARCYGTDALRWWLLSEVPRVGDADFTTARLIARANSDLAGGLGNLVSRVVTLVQRHRGGVVPIGAAGPLADAVAADTALADATLPDRGAAGPLVLGCTQLAGQIGSALARFDFRAATGAITGLVGAANRYLEATEPWHLARAEQYDRVDEVLGLLVLACRTITGELAPLLPDLAARAAAALDDGRGRLPAPAKLFPRIGAD
jgi:methionyl-tRNA synthetase